MSYKKKLSLLLIFLCCVVCSKSYAINPYIWSDTSSIQILETTSNSTDLNLQSDGAILIEQSTGTVLYEHNSHEMYRPASVTKVMSLLLIMEAIDNRINFIN